MHDDVPWPSAEDLPAHTASFLPNRERDAHEAAAKAAHAQAQILEEAEGAAEALAAEFFSEIQRL